MERNCLKIIRGMLFISLYGDEIIFGNLIVEFKQAPKYLRQYYMRFIKNERRLFF